MPTLTLRLSLPFPKADNSEAPLGPAQIEALALALDNAAIYSQGILSSRPTSTSGNPGIQGRYYLVIGDSTAANNGILWLDNGTGWEAVGHVDWTQGMIADVLENLPTASAALNGIRFYATDQHSERLCIAGAWARIGEQPGKVSINLTGTATPGYILLQGQVWPSTTGIYADIYAALGEPATVPDFGTAAPVGYKSGDDTFGTLLATAGAKKHTLALAELPEGTMTRDTNNTGAGSGGGDFVNDNDAAGTPFSIVQPSLVVNFEAKL